MSGIEIRELYRSIEMKTLLKRSLVTLNISLTLLEPLTSGSIISGAIAIKIVSIDTRKTYLMPNPETRRARTPPTKPEAK